jgi:hypothetical protein
MNVQERYMAQIGVAFDPMLMRPNSRGRAVAARACQSLL